MSLKELLLFFENQENQIERKNQVLFVFIGLLLTLSFNIFHNFTKFEQISLIISLIMIGIFCVSSFFPLGTYVNSSSKFVNKILNFHGKKHQWNDNNYLNFSNWKNFKLTKLEQQLDLALLFFKFDVNQENLNFCKLLIATSKWIYVKILYFQITIIIFCLYFMFIYKVKEKFIGYSGIFGISYFQYSKSLLI